MLSWDMRTGTTKSGKPKPLKLVAVATVVTITALSLPHPTSLKVTVRDAAKYVVAIVAVEYRAACALAGDSILPSFCVGVAIPRSNSELSGARMPLMGYLPPQGPS